MAAGNTVRVSVIIHDDGTMELTSRGANKLRKELDAIGVSAQKAEKEIKKVAGSKAAGAALSKTNSAFQENVEYRNARGVAGTGGGGSRDFAKQAQGLGGLVHLYATFAANIFAVSAAFGALAKAMDIQKMEEASDLLSSKIGVSVNVLAKDLVKLTDHALSFQDALRAVNIGLQSKISTKNLKELVTIAKGAAIVMGRDMNDAIDRIIRGTAKQEQEILDELGIIVRAKQAQEEYAKAIGKTGAEALNAAEKQEAFTLAVIKGGEKQKEFAALAASPYDKLLASLKEVGLSVLNFINGILGPIASFLSENKGLILSLLAAITAYLLTKALPTLRLIGDNLSKIQNENIAKSQRMIEAITSKKKLGVEDEVVKLSETLSKVRANGTEIRNSVNNTLGSIAGLVSKTNEKLHDKLKLKAEDLLPTKEELNAALNKSITGLNTAIKSAREGKGIYSKLGEEARNSKALALEEKRDKLLEHQKILMTAQIGQLAMMEKALERELALETQINRTKEHGLSLDSKSSALINAINRKRAISTNTLEQSQRVADTLNDPLATTGDKVASIFAGFKNSGKYKDPNFVGPLKPGSEIVLQAGKIESIMEKTKFGFQALGLVGEAVLGTLGKIFIWFTVISVASEILGTIARAFGLWDDKASKAKEASVEFGKVLKTQSEFMEKNKELLTSTNLETEQYISKWTGILNIYDQAGEKLKELLLAHTQLNKDGGFLSKLYDSQLGRDRDRVTDVKTQLTNIAKDTNISETVRTQARTLNNQIYFPKDLTDQRVKQINELLDANSLVVNSNKLMSESFKGLADGIADSYAKIDQHTLAFKNRNAEDIWNKIDSSFTNLISSFKRGTIDVKGMTDGLSSYISELAKMPTKLKEKLPDLLAYMQVLQALRDLISGKYDEEAAKAGKSVADFILERVKQDAEKAKKILDSVAGKALLSEAERLHQRLKGSLALIQDNNKTEKGDPEAKRYQQQVDLLNNKIQEQQKYLELLDFELSKYEKINGYKSQGLINSKLSAELAKNELEFTKQIAEATEKERQAKKLSGTDRVKAAELASAAKQAAQEAKDFADKKALAAAEEETIISKITEYNKTILATQNIELSVISERINQEGELLHLTDLEKENRAWGLKQVDLEIKKQALLNEMKARGVINPALQPGAVSGLPEDLKRRLAEYDAEAAKAEAVHKYNVALKEQEKQLKINQNIVTGVSNILQISEDKGVYSLEILEAQNIAKEIQYNYQLSIANEEEKVTLQLQRQLEMYEDQKKLLEYRKKNFFSNEDFDRMQVVVDEAQRQLEDFRKGMKDTITGTFEAVYAGMDSAIDAITDKIMRSEKLDFKTIIKDMRNVMAEEFRKMAADQIKAQARSVVVKILEAVTDKKVSSVQKISTQDYYQKSLDYLRQIATKSTTPAEDSTKKPEEGAKEIDPEKPFEGIMNKAKSLFTGIWEFISKGFSNLFGESGILSSLLQNVGKWLSDTLFNVIGGSVSGGGGFGSLLAKGWEFISGLFANGGVMSEYGPMKLQKYASGGVATGPQLALFGEGRKNEAYVPLPDNRSIPVTLNGGTSGNTSININITDNSVSSSAESDKDSDKDKAKAKKEFADRLAQMVREEMVKQKRPGGLLYGS